MPVYEVQVTVRLVAENTVTADQRLCEVAESLSAEAWPLDVTDIGAFTEVPGEVLPLYINAATYEEAEATAAQFGFTNWVWSNEPVEITVTDDSSSNT